MSETVTAPLPEPETGPEPSYEPHRPPPPVSAAILAAAIFLTRLPLPFGGTMTPDLFGRAMAWFPLIGAGLGIGAGVVLGVLGVVMPLHRGPGLSIGVIVGVGLGLLGVAVGLLAWRRRF